MMTKKNYLLFLLLWWMTLSLHGAKNQPCQMMEDMVTRLMPDHAREFSFELVSGDDENFSVRSDGGRIIVSGNSCIAMAVGLNHYLKNYCLTEVSWKSQNAVVLPRELPALDHVLHGKAKVKQRFFLNYCTFGYTMPWWGWKEWERLIDWMALNGVTMPLANTGMESVLQRLWRKEGLSDGEILNHFVGPAFLPWQRMSNVNSWMGPLPQSWIDGQERLQQKILQRERSFGMKPILAAFNGSVPLSWVKRNPKAQVTEVSQWGGFGKQFRTYFLSPKDPRFKQLQKIFIEEQTRLFGTDHYYCLDCFNEVQPPSWQPEELRQQTKLIHQSLDQADPVSVWVQMGWFFYNDQKHWTLDAMRSFLSGIPKGRMMMLDYYIDHTELWKRTDAFYGHQFLTCVLANFGGNTMLQGDMDKVSARLDEALRHGSNMVGIGATMEGFGVNPDFYEFVFDKAWETGISDEQWKQRMADRHVGYANEENRQAWKTIIDKLMPSYVGESGTVVCAQPSFTACYMNKTYPDELRKVWRQLIDVKSDKREHLYDIVNVGRQVLGNFFQHELQSLHKAYEARQLDSINYYSKRMEDMLDDLDDLLACNEEFSLEKWVSDARGFGTTLEEKDYYERNARAIITIWGDSRHLTDYANRTWSGMVSSYYKKRWQIFIDHVRKAVESNKAFAQDSCNRDIISFERRWIDPQQTPIVYPVRRKDVKALAEEIYGKWFTLENELPKLNEANIPDVIQHLTLREKAMLVVGGLNEGYKGEEAIAGFTKKFVPGAAGTTIAIPRLGIPSTVMADGPAGLRISPTREGETRTYYATGFPIGSSLACTWNKALVERVGQAIGNEVKEYGCDVILGPGMNIQRSPLCGRNFEYYSEDPVLSGNIAAAYVNGVQSQGVGTSVKHFAVNSQETDRTKTDERVSQRALREIYLRGFEIALKKSKPWTVMSSYNKINGVFSMENYDLLTTVLRDEWGYEGMVVTDWMSQRNTAAEVHAGNDLMMPGDTRQMNDIIEGVKRGEISMVDLNRNVERVLRYIIKTPAFHKYKASNSPDLKAHAQVAYEAGAEGMVLLKNSDGTLPLKHVKKIALMGANAYQLLSGGLGSGCVHSEHVSTLTEGLSANGISVTDTMSVLYKKYVDYAEDKFLQDKDIYMWFLDFGQHKYPEITHSYQTLFDESRRADAAVIVISRQTGEGIDMQADCDFLLNAEELQLIRSTSDIFHQAGKPVVVVINSGNMIDVSAWRDQVDAILMAWQPGVGIGRAIADVLTGKVNPSGKLSMTWPVSVYDNPAMKNFPQDMPLYDYKRLSTNDGGVRNMDYTNHEEDIYVGYRYFDAFHKQVAYPFGYGLSYTTFSYGRPVVHQKGDAVMVNLTVKNTGCVAGKEIVQLYAASPRSSSLEKPVQELKAFAKTRDLAPGESQQLTLSFTRDDLASFNEAKCAWIIDAGKYQLRIGASSRDIRVTIELDVKGKETKVHDVLSPKVKLELLKVKQNKEEK